MEWLDMSGLMALLELPFPEAEATRKRGHSKGDYGMFFSSYAIGLWRGYTTAKGKRFSDAVLFFTLHWIPLLVGTSIDRGLFSDGD